PAPQRADRAVIARCSLWRVPPGGTRMAFHGTGSSARTLVGRRASGRADPALVRLGPCPHPRRVLSRFFLAPQRRARLRRLRRLARTPLVVLRAAACSRLPALDPAAPRRRLAPRPQGLVARGSRRAARRGLARDGHRPVVLRALQAGGLPA